MLLSGFFLSDRPRIHDMNGILLKGPVVASGSSKVRSNHQVLVSGQFKPCRFILNTIRYHGVCFFESNCSGLDENNVA